MRINRVGVDGRATVVAMREVGADPVSSGKTIEFDRAGLGDFVRDALGKRVVHAPTGRGFFIYE